MNLKLRYAIDKARAVSMPKDNIDRAIKRGTGEMEGVTYEEITYEGFGPGGVAIMVDVLTDNRNRTSGEVRKIFERGGGNMGASGCVGYMFERKGLFAVSAQGTSEDALMEIALDAGADDLKRQGDIFEITCDPAHFNAVKAALEAKGVTPTNAEITQFPKVSVDTDTESARKVMAILENLDDHDDAQNVYSNLNLTDEVLAGMEHG
jgi:YebC/PmpR family DNA-binding regulatory protein